MSDNLVREFLRAIRGDMAVMSANIRDIKHRLAVLEVGQAAIHRDIAGLYELQAASSLRVDTPKDRVQRIERRLDLVGPA